MGNVRPEKVKKIARELFEKYPSKFTNDFEKNKKVLETMVNTPSKSLRNTIAGYVTRLVIHSQPEETSETEDS